MSRFTGPASRVAMAALICGGQLITASGSAAQTVEAPPQARIDADSLKVRLRETLEVLDRTVESTRKALDNNPGDQLLSAQYQTARERRREIQQLLDELDKAGAKKP